MCGRPWKCDIYDCAVAFVLGDMSGWRCMDPADWSESDVLDFIYSLDGTAPETLSGERFRGLSGARLSRLPLDDFVSRDHRHGALIYRRLHAIIDQRPCLGYIHGRPQEGARGSPDPPGFRHKSFPYHYRCT